jgi:hypothetical protein
MSFVTTEGLTLFGPGSEWFWSMLQFVVVAVTLVGIYYQLRVTRSANNFEQARRLAEDLASERTARNALEICLALKSGVKPEDLPEGPVSYMQDYWENVAGLVRAGHLEARLLDRFAGGQCRWWWAALEANVRNYRYVTGNARSGEHLEWLAQTMARMERKTGLTRVVDEAAIARGLDRTIDRSRARIRIAEELRSVTAPPPGGDRETPAASGVER